MNNVSELSKKYLLAAYLRTNGDPSELFRNSDIYDELELEKDEFLQVESYLLMKGAVKQFTMGGLGASLFLTFKGIRDAELYIQEGDCPDSVTFNSFTVTRDSLNELLEKRFDVRVGFIRALYEAALAGKSPSAPEIAKSQELDKDETVIAAQYFENAGWIKFALMNGPYGFIDMTSYGLQRTEELLRRLEKDSSKGNGYGQQMSTESKIERLREMRNKSRRNGEITLFKTIACHQVPIDPKTVKRHAPELWSKWNDWEFDRENREYPD